MENKNEIKMDLNDKNFQMVAAAIAKDISDSGAKCDTFDEMYETVSKYVNVTKEQFKEYYGQAKDKLTTYNENHELGEEELDMVVGGGLGSWLADHAVTIGIVAAGILLFAAGGAVLGAGIGAAVTAIAGNLTVAAGTAYGAALGATFAGGPLVLLGAGFIACNSFKNLDEVKW